MKSSVPLSRRALPVWLHWRFAATRDAILLLGIGIIIFAFADVYDLPPHLLQFGLDHADWEVDDVIFVVFMLSIALMVYGFRRYRDLSVEMKARISAETEARKLARHDPLTGLPNRRFFEERLEECLGTASASHQVAVLMLDLWFQDGQRHPWPHCGRQSALRIRSAGLSHRARGRISCQSWWGRVYDHHAQDTFPR